MPYDHGELLSAAKRLLPQMYCFDGYKGALAAHRLIILEEAWPLWLNKTRIERADVYAYSPDLGMSIVLECKTSISDLRANKKKNLQIGNIRSFIVPADLTNAAVVELLDDYKAYENWGLISIGDMPDRADAWREVLPPLPNKISYTGMCIERSLLGRACIQPRSGEMASNVPSYAELKKQWINNLVQLVHEEGEIWASSAVGKYPAPGCSSMRSIKMIERMLNNKDLSTIEGYYSAGKLMLRSRYEE